MALVALALAAGASKQSKKASSSRADEKTPADGAPPVNRPDPSQAAAAPEVEVIGRTQRDPRVASLRNAINARLVPRGFVPIAPGDTLDGPTCGALDALEASGLVAFGQSELERVFNVRLECTQRVAPEPFDGSSNVAQRWMMAVGSADISQMRDVAQGIATDSAITRRAVWSSSLAAIADELERNTRAALSS